MAFKYSKTYSPQSKDPFKLSRSKIDLFFDCQRCFYLDRRLGVSRPQGFPFNLNSAVDLLLKKEFDEHREDQTPHHYMIDNDIEAVPFAHKDIDVWRENFTGIQFLHPDSNFLVFGAVDDVWVYTEGKDEGKLIVVDYKATSKDGEVGLDADWQDSYKRQVEVYNWLLKNNGFDVSADAYFVYANGLRNAKSFDDKLEFDIRLIKHICKIDWIDKVLMNIKKCLDSDLIPNASKKLNYKGEECICEYCDYREKAGKGFIEHVKKTK